MFNKYWWGSIAMTSGSENIPDLPFPGETVPPPAIAADNVGPISDSAHHSVLRPWGPWATVGWTLLCLAVLVITQILVLIIFVVVRMVQGPPVDRDNLDSVLAGLPTNGNLLAAATLASTPAMIGLVVLLVRIKRHPIREYLALSWPGTRAFILAVIGLAVVLAATDLTSYSLGRPIVPDFMVDACQTAWLPFLLLALVVLAPLGEETLFRGFLYKGIEVSRGGPVTAIIVSTVIFSVIHVQYDWYGILSVAVMGFYLGVARYRFSSTQLTMVLHAIANAVATAEVFVLLQLRG
jgi:membrane protease YdiL (CAAX protease family)